MAYSAVKSVQKAAVPALLPAVAAVLPPLAQTVGISMDYSQTLTVLITVFGLVKGIANWFKNRRK